MSPDKFQQAYVSIQDASKHLLDYVKEIRQGLNSQSNRDEILRKIEKEIEASFQALNEQKFQVAVIAAMKAGKSTFLNALIGVDILASETEACTVCRTDIRPISSDKAPQLFEYRESQTTPVLIAEGSTELIREEFRKRTHEIRLTNNKDKTIRFELRHSIEAIGNLSALKGFTLVDTPGPNEWDSAGFNTIELKKTALQALRTCDVILFILDYTSFKDNTNSEMLRDLIEQRSEFLSRNTGKIYFILNKVDRKAQKDRSIGEIVDSLKKDLIGFGIPHPIIYTTSAWQALLSKLIQSKLANKDHRTDFKDFFLARYFSEDEDGNVIVPKLADVAPKALEDSGIKDIEESILQAVVRNSGWILLSEVLAKLDKAAKSLEDSLNTEIRGWQIEITSLKQKIDEYEIKAESARGKVQSVKKSIKEQQDILVNGFSEGISLFAKEAKNIIAKEIKNLVNVISSNKPLLLKEQNKVLAPSDINIPVKETKFGFKLPEWVPFFGGTEIQFETKVPLIDYFDKSISNVFANNDELSLQHTDPYIIRLDSQAKAKEVGNTINNFCTPHIKAWWLDTQDKLIREGTEIRRTLVHKIQDDIQQISDELSSHLGESLQVELNINPIQFPKFEFEGIDAKINHQVQVYTSYETRTSYRRESKFKPSGSFCVDGETYIEQVPYKERVAVEKKHSFYEIDLHHIEDRIKQQIDNQANGSREILKRVIEKQIAEDFRNAENQIDNYIKKFDDDLKQIAKERETRESEAPQVICELEKQKNILINQYIARLASIQNLLSSWKPM